jgi:hypothetical protein
MIHSGRIADKKTTSGLSFVVWGISSAFFISFRELYKSEFWTLNVVLQAIFIVCFAYKFFTKGHTLGGKSK